MGVNVVIRKELGSLLINSCIVALAFGLALGGNQFGFNNSSPAVLDSTVTFEAFLNITSGGVKPSSKVYKYVWNDSTSPLNPVITYGNGFSKLYKIYTAETMDTFKPGKYQMTINVMEKLNESLPEWQDNENDVVSGTMPFELTEHLNTKARLNQTLSTISPEGVYATKQNLSISVELTDNLTTSYFLHELYVNNTQVAMVTSREPVLVARFERAGLTHMNTKMTAYIMLNSSAVAGGSLVQNVTRYQWVNKTVFLKDEVRDIKYLGESEYDTGQNISASFTCYGSPPFIFSWGVAADIVQPTVVKQQNSLNKHQSVLHREWIYNSSRTADKHNYNSINSNGAVGDNTGSLPPHLFVAPSGEWLVADVAPSGEWLVADSHRTNHCFAELSYVFNEVGNFTVFLRVQNDVGYETTQVVLQVVQPGDYKEALVTAFCVIIALVAFSAILVAYFNHRRSNTEQLSPKEETADHYFYFNRKDGNAFREYRSIDDSSFSGGRDSNGSVGLSICVPISKNPRKIKAGMSVMYNTAKNWVTGAASSHGSQNSFYSQTYEEL